MQKWWLLFLVGSVLWVGCQGNTPEPIAEQATPVTAQATADVVIAEANIEPAEWSELRFENGGTVTEVLVAEGQQVAAGAVLVRLDDATVRASVREAEAGLAAAQAKLQQVEAGARAEEIAAAEATYQQALAQYRQLRAFPSEEDVRVAEATLGQIEALLKQAQAAYDQVSWRPEISMLPQSLNLEQVTYEYQRAQAQYDLAVEGADRDELASVRQGAERAKAQLELLQNGPTPEDITVAESAVERAATTLASAEVTLEKLQLTAPFAGTVTAVSVDPGELASPGQVVVVLATLDRLQAVTTDLTELDIVRVAVEQSATVTIDALPEQPMLGHVQCIDLQAVDYRGDVTYPVTLVLDDPLPELRWGMTALVEIAVR